MKTYVHILKDWNGEVRHWDTLIIWIIFYYNFIFITFQKIAKRITVDHNFITFHFQKIGKRMEQKQCSLKDSRILLMNEILQGIKVKCYIKYLKYFKVYCIKVKRYIKCKCLKYIASNVKE